MGLLDLSHGLLHGAIAFLLAGHEGFELLVDLAGATEGLLDGAHGGLLLNDGLRENETV